MAGARHRADAPLILPRNKSCPRRIGLLGGSFNPAHEAHRGISLAAIEHLGLDEVWWLVSPGNPLKAGALDMAALRARYASALARSRRARMRPTVIEQRMGTRYTVDTIHALQHRYPKCQFIWLMGADNLETFHLWAEWRAIATMLPIAVMSRPGYTAGVRRSPAALWLQRFVRPATQARQWTMWSKPALVQLRLSLNPISATQMRRARPDWHLSPHPSVLRDMLTHRIIQEV